MNRIPLVLQFAAGMALASTPFLTAQGSGGAQEPFPGSLLHLKPVYATFVLIVGLAIALLAGLGILRRDVRLPIVAAGLGVIGGCAFEVVKVVIDNGVIYRSYTIYELRGTGPRVALYACLAAIISGIPAYLERLAARNL